jgi:hypothetical protein
MANTRTKTFGATDVTFGDADYTFGGGGVADRWVVGSPWNTINSWSTVEGGASGAAIPLVTDTVLLSDTSFAGAFVIDVNSTCLGFYTDQADTSGTDDKTGNITLGTYNLIITGPFKIANAGITFIIGSSADVGVVSGGFYIAAGSTLDAQTDSIISTSGYLLLDGTFTNNNRGAFICTGTNVIRNANAARAMYSLTINSAGTMTQNGHVFVNNAITITAGTYNISTYNCTNGGAITVASGAVLQIGVSGGTGLITNGLSAPNNSTITMLTTSIITNSGLLDIGSTTIFTTKNTGIYTQDTSANYENQNANNSWYNFTQNAGVTTTITRNSFIAADGIGTHTINGTLALNTLTLRIYEDTGTLVFGANSDMTGTGDFITGVTTLGTYTNNKSGTFSYTGTMKAFQKTGKTVQILSGDWRNANSDILTINSGTAAFSVAAGILRIKDFKLTQNFDIDVSFDNSVNNTQLIINGDVDLHAGSGTYNTIYTAGSSTTILEGTGKTIDYDNKTVEAQSVTGSVTFPEGFNSGNFACSGTSTFTYGKSYNVVNVSGAGTLQSLTGLVFIYYTGTNTFTGTLIDVVLVSNGALGAQTGLSLDMDL